MIEKVVLYKCNYCGELHESEKEAIKCLNTHNIIFVIEKYFSSYDWWGKPEGDWEMTNTFFKTYESALNYIKDRNDLRIAYKILSD